MPPFLRSLYPDKSSHGITKVRKFCEIEFYNEFPVTLKVYFVDYFGFRRLLGAVAPRTVFHFVGYVRGALFTKKWMCPLHWKMNATN